MEFEADALGHNGQLHGHKGLLSSLFMGIHQGSYV